MVETTKQETDGTQKRGKRTAITATQQLIDEHDKDNQINFSSYAQRIVNNWLKQEDKFRCMPNYLDGQNDVKSYMRETMIDWLVDVNNRFRHRRETLYLCVNIVDRYVYYTIRDKSDSVSRSNYQLVGITAYLIQVRGDLLPGDSSAAVVRRLRVQRRGREEDGAENREHAEVRLDSSHDEQVPGSVPARTRGVE